MGRTDKAMRNIMFAVSSNVIVLILKFLNRTILLSTLGEAYLGLSGLFTSIFSILDLAELGIGSSITFSMYKPLAENDTEKVKSLMRLYKKAYIIIGGAILILGMMLFPFLSYIIKDKADLVNINAIYMLYLSQTVISYCFFSYKSAIIGADQKEYKITLLNTICSIATVCLQGTVLLLFHSFMLYITVSIITTIGKNAFAAHLAEKLYPYLKDKDVKRLGEEEKTKIKNNIKGMAMYKISSKVLSSTDNIIISAFIGVAMVGKYENYNYFWMVATAFCTMLFNTYTPSIGNLYATEPKEKVEKFFRTLNFGNFWIYGMCSTLLYVLVSPFISMWFGERFVLPKIIVMLVVINLATSGLQNAVITYKDACGLFYQGRYRPVVSAGMNVVLSLIFVKYWGVAGVVAATILSRLLTTWWFDAWMVYHYVFQKQPMSYYVRYWYHMFCIAAACLLSEYLCKGIMVRLTWGAFIISMIITVIITLVMFIALNFWMNDFHEFVYTIKQLIYKVCRKSSVKKG